MSEDIVPSHFVGEGVHYGHDVEGDAAAGNEGRDEDAETGQSGIPVSEEFVVDEIETEGIAVEEDGGFGARGGGGWRVCDVGFFAEEGFEVACWSAVRVDGAFETVWARHCKV
jgi:hypothetical protein